MASWKPVLIAKHFLIYRSGIFLEESRAGSSRLLCNYLEYNSICDWEPIIDRRNNECAGFVEVDTAFLEMECQTKRCAHAREFS